jgi:hypothetical protein
LLFRARAPPLPQQNSAQRLVVRELTKFVARLKKFAPLAAAAQP